MTHLYKFKLPTNLTNIQIKEIFMADEEKELNKKIFSIVERITIVQNTFFYMTEVT